MSAKAYQRFLFTELGIDMKHSSRFIFKQHKEVELATKDNKAFLDFIEGLIDDGNVKAKIADKVAAFFIWAPSKPICTDRSRVGCGTSTSQAGDETE